MGPVIITSAFGILLLFVGLGKNKAWFAPIGLTGLAISLGLILFGGGNVDSIFSDMVVFDNFALAFNGGMIIITMLIFLLGHEYYRDMEKNVAENYTLMLFSLTGAMIMTSYTSLVMLFIGIEVLSIPLYVLSGSKRHSLRSNEASFKYFLMGSFATAIMLFGIALIYGSTAGFSIPGIEAFLNAQDESVPLMFQTGMLMLVIGLAFKVSAAPFHFWAPDVYEGSPTLITAFMATVVKMAGFAALCRLLQPLMPLLPSTIHYMIWIFTFLTLLIGNLSAIWQSSFKRFLAYSGIANSGFLLLALFGNHPDMAGTVWYYSFTYSLATVPLFSIFFSVKKASAGAEQIEMFRGLWKQKPFLALMFTIFLMSLAGIPPLAGFFAKYFVLYQVLYLDFYFMGIFAILMALTGIYYYFAVLRYVFAEPLEVKAISYPATSIVVIALCLLLILGLGVYPLRMI